MVHRPIANTSLVPPVPARVPRCSLLIGAPRVVREVMFPWLRLERIPPVFHFRRAMPANDPALVEAPTPARRLTQAELTFINFLVEQALRTWTLET